MSESTLRAVIGANGLFLVALGVWMIVSPGSFFDAIAGFGERNDHFIRDNATFQLAAGAVLLISVRERSWRVPALSVAAIWFAAHAVNHLVDIGESDPGWVGPVDFVLLVLGTVALGALAYGIHSGRIGTAETR